MKIKYKFKAALVAAFSIFTALATSLAAAAWEGNNGGMTGANYTVLNPPIGYATGVDNFAWRVDLYISANSDGKINDKVDMIGNTNLPLVGSVLCTTPGLTDHCGTTYIQTNFTNKTRDTLTETTARPKKDSNGNITGYEYVLPTLTKFNPGRETYTAYDDYSSPTSSHPVVIANNLPGEQDVSLFDSQYRFPTSFRTVQDALTKDESEAAQHTTDIINQLLHKDPNFALRIATELNYRCPDHYNSIKAKTGGTFTAETLNKYILPTGESPMVEWAVVITPLIHFYTNTAFYCNSTDPSLQHASTNHYRPSFT